MPVVSNNEFMKTFFRKEENIDIILNFIFDAKLHQIGSIWLKNFPSLRDDTPLKDSKAYKSNFQPYLENEKPENINAYTFRSYRLLQIIKDRKNFRFIHNS